MEHRSTDVQVLDRAVDVLGALEHGPLSLAGLVGATGLARATAYRLATALEQHGLAARDPQGRFTLGPVLARLGNAVTTMRPLAVVALPALETLRDATGESVQLYVARSGERVCVVSLESPHSLRTIVAVGAVLPLDRGSAGHVLAGERVGGGGWIESVEEREAGVASVSAPVRVGGDRAGVLIGAVSVSGPVERISRRPGRRHGAAVVAAAADVGRLAG